MIDVANKLATARARTPEAIRRRADRLSIALLRALGAMPREMADEVNRTHRARGAELGLAPLDPATVVRIGIGVIAAVADLIATDRTAGAAVVEQLRRAQAHAWPEATS